MRLLADLHTHTVASGHGFSTVIENAQAARQAGMELIAITDHGPAVPEGAHSWYFWNLKVLPSILSGVRILKGCEANVSAVSDNGIDLDDIVLENLDFVAVGFHPLAGCDGNDRARNTELLLRVIAHPLVDQINHPGNEEQFPLLLEPVVEAALRHNVILEINDHSFDTTSTRSASAKREREFAEAALAAGVPVSIGSDAHFAAQIGRFDRVLEMAESLGLTEEKVVSRSADAVLRHLTSKRPRPRLDLGGVWQAPSL